MSNTNGKSPEDWEANDHIENLKDGLGATGVCGVHDDLARALIWMIRHMAKADGFGGSVKRLLGRSPVAVLAVAVLLLALVIAKSNGIEVPFLEIN